jgi:glycosyltransferase involved in cell wall biosynthesis
MISCVIPTKNEARNLPHVLRTVQWCDEVIVVDMESVDDTARIAADSGARVVGVPNDPDFNSSRKVGLQAARTEWILALDADEMVPVGLAEALKAFATAGRADLALIPRLNFKLGCQRGGGLWPDYQRRFYRRDAVEFVPSTHDYLICRSDRIEFLPAEAGIALHHFNYIPLADEIGKLNRYTSADVTIASSGAAVPLWMPPKTFASLYLKHGGRKEGRPGLWWAAFRAFTDLVLRQKSLEHRKTGGVSTTESEIDWLNRETSARALQRISERGPGDAAAPLRLLLTFLRRVVGRGSRSGRVWGASLAAFHDLALEMKVWELAEGRSMAERAQHEMREVLAAQWASQPD